MVCIFAGKDLLRSSSSIWSGWSFFSGQHIPKLNKLQDNERIASAYRVRSTSVKEWKCVKYGLKTLYRQRRMIQQMFRKDRSSFSFWKKKDSVVLGCFRMATSRPPTKSIQSSSTDFYVFLSCLVAWLEGAKPGVSKARVKTSGGIADLVGLADLAQDQVERFGGCLPHWTWVTTKSISMKSPGASMWMI
jgi:hypothetical protein